MRCTAIEFDPPDPFRKHFAVRLFGYDTSDISTPELTFYALTVTNGSGDGSYVAGTVISIVADAPAVDDVFYRWVGGSGVANRSSSATTVTMPASDMTVTATYITDETLFTLTVVHGSGGGNYATGTVVTITANAAPDGYEFYAWTGDAVDDASAATTTITIGSSALLVTATYAWLGIELAWDASVSDETHGAADGYYVVWGIAPGDYTDGVNVGNVLTYQLTGLEDGVTYYIAVYAYNSAGYSGYSLEVSGMPTAHFS